MFCSGLDNKRPCPQDRSENLTLFYDGFNYTCFYVTGPANTHDSMNTACLDLLSTMAVIDTADKMRHLKRHTVYQDELAYMSCSLKQQTRSNKNDLFMILYILKNVSN